MAQDEKDNSSPEQTPKAESKASVEASDARQDDPRQMSGSQLLLALGGRFKDPSLLISIVALSCSIYFAMLSMQREDETKQGDIARQARQNFYQKLEKINASQIRYFELQATHNLSDQGMMFGSLNAMNNVLLDSCLEDLEKVNFEVAPSTLQSLLYNLFSFQRFRDLKKVVDNLPPDLVFDSPSQEANFYTSLMRFYGKPDTAIHDSDQSQHYFEQAMKAWDELLGEYRIAGKVDTLSNRLGHFVEQGEMEKARLLYEQIAELVAKMPDANHYTDDLRIRADSLKQIVEGHALNVHLERVQKYRLVGKWKLEGEYILNNGKSEPLNGEIMIRIHHAEEKFEISFSLFDQLGIVLAGRGSGLLFRGRDFRADWAGLVQNQSTRGVLHLTLDEDEETCQVAFHAAGYPPVKCSGMKVHGLHE